MQIISRLLVYARCSKHSFTLPLVTSKANDVLWLTQKRKESLNSENRVLMNLKDKVALVTGGTTGIGLATASELLHKGVRHVVLTDIDTYEGTQAAKKLKSIFGSGKCSYLHLNVNSEVQFKDAFEHVDKTFGGVDILFNNAGILEDRKWELEVETNLKATIRANLLGLKYMRKKKNDRKSQRIIINNADICALEPLPTAPVYTATKYGVLGATRCFGSIYHFRKTGIRVVCLCSASSTDTELVQKSADKQLTPEWGMETYNHITRNRLQTPSVVGRGVVHIIKYAPTDTIWRIENDVLYISKIPHNRTFNHIVSQL